MRSFVVILCVLALPLSAAERLEGSYLHEITMEYETPHHDWATPAAGGPVRALIFAVRNLGAREVVELAQRCDLDYTAITAKHSGALAVDNVYEAQVKGSTPAEKAAEAVAKLEQDYDVIVMANVSLGALPPQAQFMLLEKVKNGTGLLVVHRSRLKYPELTKTPVDGPAEKIAGGIATRGLPQVTAERQAGELLAAYEAGGGRLVTIDYGTHNSAYWGGLALTAPMAWDLEWAARYENNMALVIRALLYAAGRDPALHVVSHNLAEGGGQSPDAPLTVTVAGKRAGTLLLRVRDAWNNVVFDTTTPVAPGATVDLPLPALAGGRHYVDFRLATERGIEDVAYGILDVPQPIGTLALHTDKESYGRGEAITGRLTLSKALPQDAEIRLDLQDSPFGRVWSREWRPLPAGKKELSIALETPPLPTIAGHLVARVILHDARVAARVAIPLFFPRREIPLFPTIAWDSVPEKYLTRWKAEQTVEKLGWEAGLAHPRKGGGGARAAALMNQQFVPYTVRIGISAHGDPDKKGWTSFYTKDFKEEFPGEGSFYDPAVQAYWKNRVQQVARDVGPYGPLVYNLGDENYYTYNAGFGPVDQAKFREFLAERHGSIDVLNTRYGSDYQTWSEAPHYTEQEARDAGNFPAWFDHRLFVEQMYADYHHRLAEWIRDVDPGARVGAEGSQPGHLVETIRTLEFWGPYSNPVLDEVLRSLGSEKLRTLWWGGYVSSHGGRSGFPRPLWRPLLLGAVNGNAWYSAAIDPEGFLGVDFTYANYFKKLLPHLQALEEAVAPVLVTTPLEPNGIAIRWDHASNTAAQMSDRFFDPRGGMSTLQDVCYRHGLNFHYLPARDIENGALRDYRILFLFGATALGGSEAAAIEAFVRDGGVVVADLNPAILDEYCAPRSTSGLHTLFGVDGLKGDAPFELRDVELPLDTGKRLTAKTLVNPEIPVWTVNRIGTGQAILLNISLNAARETTPNPERFNNFVLGLLARAGIEPSLQVHGVEGEHHVLRVRRGNGFRVVGFLADNEDLGRELRIDLPEVVFAHAVGSSGGQSTRQLRAKLDVPFKVWCLFDRQPEPPDFKLDHHTGAPGARVGVISRFPAGTLLRLDWLDPDGNPLPRRRRVIVAADNGAIPDVRFAYDDPPGTYELVLTDLRTGYSAQADFQLKK